jgi:hypothetical protein
VLHRVTYLPGPVSKSSFESKLAGLFEDVGLAFQSTTSMSASASASASASHTTALGPWDSVVTVGGVAAEVAVVWVTVVADVGALVESSMVSQSAMVVRVKQRWV